MTVYGVVWLQFLLQDLVVDEKLLQIIKERIGETDEEVSELIESVVCNSRFPVTAWLQGK